MSWQQRPYAQNDVYAGQRRVYHGSGLGTWSMVTTIIVVNCVVYFLTHMTGPRIAEPLLEFGLMQGHAVLRGEVWRLLTATYLHINFYHIFGNMLGVYFFGPALERVWGPRQFFLAYTAGGVAGNIVLTLASLVGFINPQTLGLGASGSVLTLVGAVAVLFPTAKVYVYFLFPIGVRTFALLYGLWFVYNITRQGGNYGGDICHLAGLLVGLWWAQSGGVSLSGRHRVRPDSNSLLRSLFGRGARRPQAGRGAWQRRIEQRRADAEIIDRILRKIRDRGIRSLTPAERRQLEEATRRRQEENDEQERQTRT